MRQRKRRTTALIGLGIWLVMTVLLTVSPAPSGLLGSAYAQTDSRAIGAVRVESNQAGELAVSWDAPAETPNDYRIAWARVDDDFPTWRNPDVNAYPTSPAYTITGLDEGVRYNLWLRARYDDGAGDWSGPHEAVVAAASTATVTSTRTEAPTATHTATAVPTEVTPATATATATEVPTETPTVTAAPTDVPTATSTATDTATTPHTSARSDGHAYAGRHGGQPWQLPRCGWRAVRRGYLRCRGMRRRQRRALRIRPLPYPQNGPSHRYGDSHRSAHGDTDGHSRAD